MLDLTSQSVHLQTTRPHRMTLLKGRDMWRFASEGEHVEMRLSTN